MTKSRNNVIISVCRKTSIVDKKGVAGAKPPTGTRGGSPSNIAPSHGEGVWGFGKDAEIERPKALCKDAYKWSNKVGAGRTDNKRPRLQRRKAHKAFL